MSNIDWFNYEGQKSQAGTSYNTQRDKNAYARELAKLRGSRKQFDLKQAYEIQTPRVTSSFSRRGLAGPGVSSGIYQKALSDYYNKNLEDLTRAQQDTDAEVDQLNLSDRELLDKYNQTVLDIDREKNRLIAEEAARLTSFKPFLSYS
jgi:hypothetical protein